MEEQDKTRLIEQYIEAYNAFDIDGMLATLSGDIQFENLQNGDLTASAHGTAEFAAMAEQSKDLFTQRQQSLSQFEFDADVTKVNIDYQGTLAVDLPNGFKAGQVLSIKGRSEFQFSNGKISLIRDIS